MLQALELKVLEVQCFGMMTCGFGGLGFSVSGFGAELKGT